MDASKLKKEEEERILKSQLQRRGFMDAVDRLKARVQGRFAPS